MILQSKLYTPTGGPAALSIPMNTPVATPSTNTTAVTPDALSSEIMALAMRDPNQKRKGMKFHPLLFQVALERAKDMAAHNYVGHKGFDGHYINWYLRQKGYKLPSWYGADENNCESIAAGQTTAAQAWSAWLGHQPHRIHVVGEDRFWGDQVDFAIAHFSAPSTAIYSDFWVFVSART